MAEINREDLFSDEALNATKELAKLMGDVADSIDKITAAGKKSQDVLKSTGSISGITKETEHLTQQEKELIKVQNQISVALAKNNEEYIAQKRGLDAINKVINEKVKATKSEENSILALTEANKALKKQRDLISTSTEEGRKKIASLNAEIDKNTEQIKANSTAAEKQKANIGNYASALTDLKTQLKEAKAAMIVAADAGGTMSKEYQDAAKAAGEIADKIGDAKDEAKVFANDTAFGAIGTRVSLLKDKVMALDFKGVGEQLKGLGKIILANPLLLLAGVVIGIGSALYTLRDSIPFVSKALDSMGKATDFVVQKMKDLADWMGITEFAAKDKSKAIVEASDAEIKSVTKAADQQIAIAAALGKDTVELEKKKWKDIIAAAEAGRKAAYDPTKELKDQSDKYKELYDVAIDATIQMQILNNKAIKADQEAKAKAADEDKRIAEESEKFIRSLRENSLTHKYKLYEDELKLKQEFIDKFKSLGANEVDIESKVGDAILQARIAIQKKITKGEEDSLQLRKELLAQNLKDTQDIYLQFSSAIGGILDGITASQLQNIELEKKANKEKLDRDLENAGTNEAAKTEIKKKAAKEDARLNEEALKLRRRMAIYDKATAIIAAGINTAVGITNALAKTATIPLIPFISALGALQVAAIAAKPIPKFAKGTNSAPGGTALVGELGRELLLSPSGKIGLTPDSPTLMNLTKGTKVIPNDETMKMLAMNGLSSNFNTQKDLSLLYEISDLKKTIKEYDGKIIDAISNNRVDLVRQGSLIYSVKKTSDGNKKIIRSKSMG